MEVKLQEHVGELEQNLEISRNDMLQLRMGRDVDGSEIRKPAGNRAGSKPEKPHTLSCQQCGTAYPADVGYGGTGAEASSRVSSSSREVGLEQGGGGEEGAAGEGGIYSLSIQA